VERSLEECDFHDREVVSRYLGSGLDGSQISFRKSLALLMLGLSRNTEGLFGEFPLKTCRSYIL
jgi:hypothetical protein